MKLNPEQLDAVHTLFGPVLVLAGAGTGKTRVITERAVEIIKKGAARPESVLCITFTNKAALEMRERIAKRIGHHIAGKMIISTFHSFGGRLLRKKPEFFKRSHNFNILGTSGQISIIRTSMRDLGIHKTLKPDIILSRISIAKNADCEPNACDEYGSAAAMIYPRYENALMACNSFDFDDLLLRTLELLKKDSDFLTKIRKRIRFIQIDEYQDTNSVQFELMRLICNDERNICAVGDDDQSIYSWRGAKIENILNFEDHFGPNVKVCNLIRNYRSSDEIVQCATAVVEENPRRRTKWLKSVSGNAGKVRILGCEDELQEISMIMSMLRNYHEKGGKYRDWAVLFRTGKYMPVFEEELKKAEILYTIIGGQKFFERKEIKDFTAYLTLVINESNNIAFLRVINYPSRGLGKVILDKIQKIAESQKCSLFAAGRHLLTSPQENITNSARKSLDFFYSLLAETKALLERTTLRKTFESLLNGLNLRRAIDSEAQNPEDADNRYDRILHLIDSAENFVSDDRVPYHQRTLAGYLERIALYEEDDNSVNKETNNEDALMLITIHSAKGLEFQNVIIPAFEDGNIPHSKSVEESFSGIEEERRLCYVAMTRAKRSLTLMYALNRTDRGRERHPKPSRFLLEIPDEFSVKMYSKVDPVERKKRFIQNFENSLGVDEE